jgi:Uma2 family endonuclease
MSQARVTPAPMTVAEFLRWHEDRDETEQYELEDGVPVLMAPERLEHATAKAWAWRALQDAADSAGLPCQAYVDGPMVPIAADRAYQSDAVMRCGPPLPPDSTLIPDPLVLVEVVSPNSGRQDRVMKLEGYFILPSVRHHLVVLLARRRVIHHRRADAAAVIETRILGEEAEIVLDPPGFALPVAALLPAAPDAA